MSQVSTAGASEMSSSDPAKRISGDVLPSAAARAGCCFDCNICLEFAVEPVVTRCGHLYCWPCIYEWLRRNAEAHAGDGSTSAKRPCPVCKGPLTQDSLVPLYGRGGSRSDKPWPQPAIPRRPTVHREAVEQETAQISGGDGHQHVSTELDSPTRSTGQAHHHAGAARFDMLYPPPIGQGMNAARFDMLYPPPIGRSMNATHSTAVAGGVPGQAHHHAGAARFDMLYPPPLGRGMNTTHSTAGGVLGGMAMAVLPWVFGGQVQAPSAYYSSPYHPAALQNMSPRLRRHHMEVERSLHQLLFFLFVFVALCLLLF